MNEPRKKYPVTTQATVRAMFWEAHPEADRQKIRSYDGRRRMYKTETRVLFCDYVDSLCRAGIISPALAYRVTL